LRQLCNALRTACALLDDGETTITWRHLPDDLIEEMQRQVPRQRLSETPATVNLRAVSESTIGHAIGTSGGNMSEAARRLGISRNTLYRRLKRGKAEPSARSQAD
jgi:transcriptional regulator of acetoin/glycerol metabolism